ncbi:MAG: hypothetical protein JWO38_1861 [Gemmataceae bacterium]|nr:hypothetical protein [Gemmataceae bacterium]
MSYRAGHRDQNTRTARRGRPRNHMPRTIFQTILRAGRMSAADPAAALRRFVAGDPDSFAELIERYGPMVYGVCRRVLGPSPDADDAFQTTFLALAGHARSIRDPDALPGWLHRTALNAARKTRTTDRPIPDRGPEPVAGDDPLAEASWREVRILLDEELNALSAIFRGPLILCYLEARTHEEAASALGVSVSTLKRRLDRGRELLRARMIRRGVGAAGLTVAVLGGEGLIAAAPGRLVRAVVTAAASAGPGAPTAATGSLLPLLSRRSTALATSIGVAIGAVLLTTAGGPSHPEAPKTASGSGASSDQPAPGIGDRAGDPLPDGATARLGTGWLRGYRCRFSPNGKVVVRERADGGLQLFEVPTGRPLARIRGTDVPEGKEIIGSTIGFSPDGKLLAALWEGRCGIWETATGKPVRWLESGKFYSLLKCIFSPDGTLLAVGDGLDNRGVGETALGVYEVGSGRRLFTTPGSNGAFATDGKSLVAWNGYGSDRNTARRLSVPEGRVLTEFTYGDKPGDFGPLTEPSDGRWFFEVTAPRPGADRQVRVWDVVSGTVRYALAEPRGNGDPWVFILHAPGRRELILADPKLARVWCRDLNTGMELWRADLPEPVGYTRLSADGSTLVTGDEIAGTVTVWDAASGKKRRAFAVGGIGHSSAAHVSPDGRTIATESGGGVKSTTVAFWDAGTGKLLSELPGHPSAITVATFAPGGKTAYTIGRDNTLRTWDPAVGRELARFAADPAEQLIAPADGTNLFAADPDGAVRVLDARTGKTLRRFPAFTKALVGLAATADGNQLVAGGRDGPAGSAIRVIDPTTGKTVREFATTSGRLEQLAVRPDGGAVIASYLGREVVVWAEDGKRVAEHRGRGKRKSAWVQGSTPYEIGSVAASPDGRWFAYSDQEEGVVILDARTGREVKRVKLTEVYYQDGAARYELRDVLAFAPDGKTVVWSGVESTADVYVIEVRSGLIRRKLPGDSYPVQRLAFSPDGTALVSAGSDGSALIWDVAGRAARKPAGPPDPARVAGWWGAIGGSQAEKADAAMREMVAHPAAAVTLLRDRVKPVKPVEAARLDGLMARLKGPEFDDREAATRELVDLGDAAGPRLREAARSTDPEIARRATTALNRIESVDRVRAERAVEVLERIADPAAVALLRELAGGMPDAALTVDAARAIARRG